MKLTTIYYGSDIIRYTVQTFGCKVNQYESASVAKAMDEHGYEKTDDIFTADIVIINSCSVTENSDKKAKQLINRIKSSNPMKIVVLTGCFPQAFPETASKLSADIVTGTEHKDSIADMIDVFTGNKVKQVAIPPRPVKKQYEKQKNADMGKTRAFIKIEDGCDRFCSYCVERVRLSSLEPELLTDEDIARMAAQKKLCPHFHLSLQSGSSATLKRMNRHYTPDEYYDIVQRLRKAFPDCAITTDIMVGFAGETDEEFKESCEFAKKVGFAAMHVFTYSIREGTAAARRTDHVAHDIAVKRYHTMSSLAKKLKEEYFRSCVGKTEKVLIQRRESEEYANGLTPQYVPVRIYGSDANRQDIITVQITGASGSDFCVGEEIKCL